MKRILSLLLAVCLLCTSAAAKDFSDFEQVLDKLRDSKAFTKLFENEELKDQIADLTAAAEENAKITEALQWLSIIEQLYSEEEYLTCFESMEKFRLSGTVEYLPQDNNLTETALSPAERYAILEKAVTNMNLA